MRALEQSKLRPGYDLSDPKSHGGTDAADGRAPRQPLLGILDGGKLYDAMAASLMDQGVCCFRNCTRGHEGWCAFRARHYADYLKTARPGGSNS